MSRRGRTLIGSRLGLLLGSVCAVWLLSVSVPAQIGRPSRVQVSPAPEMEIPAGVGSEILRGRCLRCHAMDLIGQQRLSRGGWERELEKMISWGAAVEDMEKKELVDYLTSNFGNERSSRTVPDDVARSAGALLETKCQMCHDLRLLEAQRLDVSGWAREVDKMTTWGARTSASENDVLVQYLTWRFGSDQKAPVYDP